MDYRFFQSQDQVDKFREDVRSCMREQYICEGHEVLSISETNLVKELRGSLPGVRKSRWSALASKRIWTLPAPGDFSSMLREAGFELVSARTPRRNNPARIVRERPAQGQRAA